MNVIIVRQLVRSATSIGANVVEAQGGASRQEFVRYIGIARKSAYESRYWLRLLQTRDPSYGSIPMLIVECHQLCKILSAIILPTRKNNE
ncbi:MAG: four helix bundle protein [Candidatus Kerfeldbacteria bacterium]|nr:four helix bundle protein [Candidatus Kerfeldbacteria bacterium]